MARRQVLPLLLLLATRLIAGGPVRVLAVIRKGLPPFPEDGRLYVLDGGRASGLTAGMLLRVRRPGDPRLLGWLQVVDTGPDRAEARQVAPGATYLLRGDEAAASPLPALPPVELPAGSLPGRPEGPHAAPPPPPWEGALFFLPGRDDLSPAGRRKLAGWVADWGRGGRWTLQVPASGTLPADLRRRRIAVLQAALQGLGVPQARVDDRSRAGSGRFDPVWVQCQPGTSGP